VRTNRYRSLLALPNIISATRVPLALLVPFTKQKESTLAIVCTAAVTDLLDGYAARKLGQTSAVGATIDGFADKAFGVTLLATLVARGVLSRASALLLATRELIELPLAIRVLVSDDARMGPGFDRGSNEWGKIATTLELGAVVASIARWRIAKPLVLAAGIAGAVAGISYWLRELRRERRHDLDRPVPYILAGGRPELLEQLAR
jgi:CDP-diacylglycerol--glycerol-3-phosphate 3-phosphatidyltransferase/cardiolipin synthase